MLLGRYLIEINTMLFAISIALEYLPIVLLKIDYKRVEVFMKSRLAIEELQNIRP